MLSYSLLNAWSLSLRICVFVDARLDVSAPKKRLMLDSMKAVRLGIREMNRSSELTWILAFWSVRSLQMMSAASLYLLEAKRATLDSIKKKRLSAASWRFRQSPIIIFCCKSRI
jgi:hypothetical protein